MVHLDCSGIHFGAYLDEKHMFEWALEITGTMRWEGDTLVMRSARVSDKTLYDLLALFHRYRIPMKQLAQFKNLKNGGWFADPKKYWYQDVFGKPSKRVAAK